MEQIKVVLETQHGRIIESARINHTRHDAALFFFGREAPPRNKNLLDTAISRCRYCAGWRWASSCRQPAVGEIVFLKPNSVNGFFNKIIAKNFKRKAAFFPPVNFPVMVMICSVG